MAKTKFPICFSVSEHNRHRAEVLRVRAAMRHMRNREGQGVEICGSAKNPTFRIGRQALKAVKRIKPV